MTHSAVSHLHPASLALAPELHALELPTETTADCANCPMVRQKDDLAGTRRMVFHDSLRCCTYHPALANYLVGRILRRGGVGAVQVRARLAELDGVSRWGIRPHQAFYDRVGKDPFSGFGTDPERRCPYWVEGPLGCSIWEDRSAVCRTWFCRHDGGVRGRDTWRSVRDLLSVVEIKLCRWLGDSGQPPDRTVATVDDWCAWYIDCADRLDSVTEAELEQLRDEGLAREREALHGAWAALEEAAMPDLLGPAITAFHREGDRVLLEGYSHYHPSYWPHEVFTLFSFMDGTVTWREALDRTERALGSARFTEADIRTLHRMGILEARAPEDLIPGARLKRRSMEGDSSLPLDAVGFDWPDGVDP